MTTSYRDLVSGFRQLDIPTQSPLIVHTSLGAFDDVRGGAETLLGALLFLHPRLMAPTHTYKTMLTPEEGPENNGMAYGSHTGENLMAEFFSAAMPADKLMGILPETLRKHPQAKRSSHPILSFAGIGVEQALLAQTLADPLAPIGKISEEDGWVLLLGVNHTVNTSIHYAEKLVGRRQFIRWALTEDGVVECPGFPGCSLGFEQAAPALESITRRSSIGPAQIRALPLQPMFTIIQDLILQDPSALLCDDPTCERCTATREAIAF